MCLRTVTYRATSQASLNRRARQPSWSPAPWPEARSAPEVQASLPTISWCAHVFSICHPNYLSFSLVAHPPIHASIYISIYLSTCLCICLSFFLYVEKHMSIHPRLRINGSPRDLHRLRVGLILSRFLKTDEGVSSFPWQAWVSVRWCRKVSDSDRKA